MNYANAIHKHFLATLTTNSKMDLFNKTKPLVYIATCKFNGLDYIFIKNYTSKIIKINDLYMNAKTVCIQSSDVPSFINGIKFYVADMKLELTTSSLSIDNPYINNHFKEIDESDIVFKFDVDLTPSHSELRFSDDPDYLYSLDLTDEMIPHFKNHNEKDNVLIKYKNSSNTLLHSKLVDKTLCVNDFINHDKYVQRLIHHIRYNTSADWEYRSKIDYLKKEVVKTIDEYNEVELKELLKILNR